MNETRKTDQIVWREDLYPRLETNPVTVQQYAADLTVLPPVIVNQRNELLDGWHRWTAHKKNGEAEIAVEVRQTTSDAECLEIAIEANAKHGLQLSQEDKRNMARTIYHVTPAKERDAKKKHLAEILSVSERTVREWLGRIDKDSKEARDRRIFNLWMQCRTQEEIAGAENVPRRTIADLEDGFGEIGNLAKSAKAAAEHATDFDPPIYNIWKQQTKSTEVSHFGNSEVRWVDNLLYLYTAPFDIVVDPFAGGASMLEICRKRLRRCWLGDRAPQIEREKDIRKHDLIDSAGKVVMPPVPRWKDVRLVYLDPPYWKQAERKYSADPTDLSNMTIEDFNRALSGIIAGFAKKLTSGYIALIIQPTQWKAPKRQVVDHVADMLRMVNLPVDMRFSVPYESQQHTAQMVEWAKAEKKCLVLTREIIVWRV